MKLVPGTITSVAKDANSELPSAQVCMHVLKEVRTDFRVMRSATALIEAGFAVSIVDVEGERTRPVGEDIRGVCVKHIFMSSWFTPTRFKPWFLVKATRLIIRSTLRLLRTRADIYHAHDAEALPACYIAARLRHKPLIFDAHELPMSLDDPIAIRWPRLSALARCVFAAMLPYCRGVITTSPLYAQEIRKRYHVPEVTLIRNVPPRRTVPKNDHLRQHLGLGPEIRIALYQGNMQPDRGLDTLVRAAAFLEQDIVIVMMGKAVEPTLSELQVLIAREEVTDRVKILPPVPYEELFDWTASADIGLSVLPPDFSMSIRYTLPNKLFEYLMVGLPVLTSPINAVADLIKTYNVGRIVSSLAPADVGTAINAMLADQDALAHMSRNALEAAQREFHWEKESQQLIDLYRDILGAQHAGQAMQKIPRD